MSRGIKRLLNQPQRLFKRLHPELNQDEDEDEDEDEHEHKRERDEHDEGVGFCRPPKSHQFQKGKSGNPRGRPKGALNLKTALARELRKRVTVKVNGRTKVITKMEAIAQQLVNAAAQGNLKPGMFLAQMSDHLLMPPAIEDRALCADEQALVANLIDRLKHSGASSS